MNINELDIYEKGLSLSVDASIINRLGQELVGRAETAVSELIKNAYDADATIVDVKYFNSNGIGGTLVIEDNGLGMELEQLIKGFMTIASTDKVHNPKSVKYDRSRAGKKGIGRFATQRLGTRLVITTQTINNDFALQVTIDWDKYTSDQAITSVYNPIKKVEKIQEEGTRLSIENLRDEWTFKDIERVYRYISELFQPDYLSEQSSILKIANRNDNSFNVFFSQTVEENTIEIANPQIKFFDKALAVIEGFIDSTYDGYIGIKSESLGIEDYDISIEKSKSKAKFEYAKNIHFKAYYFIYNRPNYYKQISNLELSSILKQSREIGGIRLYRNGFRVLPYGENNNDWLNLDRRNSQVGGENSELLTNIPFANQNLFGFVEIIDAEGKLYEETASREGLIENEAYLELADFMNKSMIAARRRLAEGITKFNKNEKKKNSIKIKEEKERKTADDFNTDVDEAFEKEEDRAKAKEIVKEILAANQELLEEIGMLRVLAGLGLTIAQFTHEITQSIPSINGLITALYNPKNENDKLGNLDLLQKAFARFTSYTSYFSTTISQNVSRELRPVNLIEIINEFSKVIKEDLEKQGIEFIIDPYSYDLITTPMHISEWGSILFNLYTNAKKAIQRQSCKGKIAIITGEENDKIYLEFTDNGDGIPEENQDRIFNAFFTTSTPAGFAATNEEKLTGTGLGLKIVKDIIETYKGTIFIIPPESGFSTCFRIEIPKVTDKQRKEYGI